MAKGKTQITFQSKIESAIYTITGKFLATKIINHSLTKGEEREDPLIEFLNDNLPKKFSVVKGEVVDLFNSSSPQIDIMIYDNSRNIPLYSGGSCILPAEALLASIEIKSKLTQDETKKILKSVEKLKSLKPFRQALDKVVTGRSENDKVICRYYHCVFAYDTDISETDWITKEITRIRNVAEEEVIESTLIDQIFVLNKGLINVAHSIGKGSDNNTETFLYFYMNLVNFLERENGRRKTVPYLEYAGNVTRGYKKI